MEIYCLFLSILVCLFLLAAPGLSGGTWDFRSSLRHVGSSSLTRGSNPGPLPWELGVLATEPPGKSPTLLAVITVDWFYRCALVRKSFRGCSGVERRVLDFLSYLISSAQSLQLCQTFCDHMDYSPPGSSIHGDSLGKNTGVGCHALLGGSSQPRGRTCISCLLQACWQACSLPLAPPGKQRWANYFVSPSQGFVIFKCMVGLVSYIKLCFSLNLLWIEENWLMSELSC